jgi:hypothetical protein
LVFEKTVEGKAEDHRYLLRLLAVEP